MVLGKTPIAVKIFGLIWGLGFGGVPWAFMVLPALTDNIMYLITYIVGIISNEEIDNIPVLKGTLRISNMIPVPDSELILYAPKNEKDKDYKILKVPKQACNLRKSLLS